MSFSKLFMTALWLGTIYWRLSEEEEGRMDTTTRILWSGLTGRTGMEAIKIAKDMADVSIVAGISRQNMNGVLNINGGNLMA